VKPKSPETEKNKVAVA